MATKTKPKPKRQPRERLRQRYIPELEPPSIPAVDAAAHGLMEAVSSKREAAQEEKEAHQNLLRLMREHNLTMYEFDGFTVRIDSKSKAKVKKKKAEQE